MTFSTPLLGTNTNKVKLSWGEYIWNSCIRQGWYNFAISFRNWADLMGQNWSSYALLKDDDPFEQCRLYFWDSLEDDILPKEFLEHLMQMAEDVRTGKVETVPFTKDMFDDLNDLVGDLIEDTDLTGTLDVADD